MKPSSSPRPALRPVSVLLFALSATLPALPAQVFSQPPARTGGVNRSSWVPPKGTGADTYAWDDFKLPFQQTITKVRWRGGYAQKARFGQAYDFRVSFFASAVGGSQPLITAFPSDPDKEKVIATFRTGGKAGQKSAGTFGGIAMYDYEFVLPKPVTLKGGVKYWFRVVALQRRYPDWGMATASGGDKRHYRFVTGLKTFQVAPNDLAFSLYAGWADLGRGLAGLAGVPVLTGRGTLLAKSTASITLTAARPSSALWVMLGAARVDLPLLGGTLVPRPDVILASVTDKKGSTLMSFPVPVGLPSRFTTYAQAWILDRAGVKGLAASNGLMAVTP